MAFTLTAENKKKVEELLKRYPVKKAALLPILWVVQDQEGYISKEAMQVVAAIVEVTPAHVYEVVTFYTMYRQTPPPKYHIQVCRNISCWLRGSNDILAHLKKRLGIEMGQSTKDGKFSLSTVECLAACGTAPSMQINKDYYENLSIERIDQILEELK